MKRLLDTQAFLWAVGDPDKLSVAARTLLLDQGKRLHSSFASSWKVATKRGLGREDFRVKPARRCRLLVQNGYGEVPVTADHALGVVEVAPLHRDPSDRVLIAQV